MKRIFWIILILYSFTGALGCKSEDKGRVNDILSPTEIKVNAIVKTEPVYPGDSVLIQVNISPSDASQNYTLSILNGAEYGTLLDNLFIAKSKGIAILKAVTEDGALFDTCKIVIQQKPNVRIVQDTVVNSTITSPVDIFAIRPTAHLYVVFKNNRFSAQNSEHHIVLFGSEGSGPSDHMLDSIIITGNKIVWTGNNLEDGNEGILTGYSVNATIKYNFIQDCPYGTPTKSDGFTYTSGGVAYNVYRSSFKVGTGAKGVNGVKFYNNTFYNTRNVGEGVIGSIYINSNNDVRVDDPALASTNCQIFNNIFYTKHKVANIYCDNASLNGLQCDYNIYFCEDGEPVFRIGGNTITLTKWKAMGFDQHSVVVNPNFKDVDSLIPSLPLYNGTNLGDAWQYGLDSSTQWNGSDPVLKQQGSIWQVGAYVQ